MQQFIVEFEPDSVRDIARWLSSLKNLGYSSCPNISVSSARDTNVGTLNLLSKQPDVLEKMWRGDVVTSRVQASDVPMLEQRAIEIGSRDLNLFVGAPLRDERSNIIALLAFRIDPNETLFSLLQLARLGKTGEAYIFDRLGLMLSPSRFRDDLIRMGLIESDQSSVLRVHIRDNRANQKSGLNRMAASATQGREGIDVSGYPDYRGKRAVGAWKWVEELGVGITVEQDYDEAYAIYFKMIYLVYTAAAVATLAMLVQALAFGNGRRRLRETQSRLAAVVQNAIDSIIVIDRYGIIESANPAVEKVFGYHSSELVGKNVSMLMPEPYRTQHDGYIDRFVQTGEARVIGIGREVEALRAEGSLLPAELTISRFELDSGMYFAGVLRDLTEKECRKRGSASGRAVYDDPRVAVGPLVLAEAERERRRSQHGGIRYGVASVWEPLPECGAERSTEARRTQDARGPP